MRTRHFEQALAAVPRLIVAGLGAIILSQGFPAPVAAGPLEDARAAYVRGDYATAWVKIKPTTHWMELEAFVKWFGNNNLYGEMANDRLPLILPHGNQPLSPISPSGRIEERASGFVAKADRTCSFAVSFTFGHDQRSVRLWSMPNGEPIATISLPFVVAEVAVSQDYVAAAGPDSIRLYDVKSGSFLRSLDKVGTVNLSFSESGKVLLAQKEKLGILGMMIPAKGGLLFNLATGAEYAAQENMPPVMNFSSSPTSDCAVVKQQTFPNSQ
jgi:hypothetical protein